jgi:two-component system LytT family sensor kinase
MRVEVRKYEQLLIALWAVLAVINYILQHFGIAPVYTYGFRQYLNSRPELHFDYSANLLLPRIGVVLTLIVIYFWINLFTIPQLHRKTYKSFFIYPWILFQILLLGYVLAIVVNVASYYAHPAWNNYGEFSLFALFGYNESPLTDLWAGFDRALIFLLVYAIYAGIREYLIYRIENSAAKRKYRILIANQIAASLCVSLLLPSLTSAFHLVNSELLYRVYFVFIPSVILLYFMNTYWLFPRFAKPNGASFQDGLSFQVLWRLLIITFLYLVAFSVFLNRLGLTPFILLMNWIIQLIVITPVTWVLYQQRKDKIRELKGVQIALSKSTADLQFLRSQINPHFLFNVLNTIYATALVDGSKRTADAIQMLGDMMRFMLDDNHLDFIPLNNEIGYLQNYIALQKLRIQDSDEIDIDENITVDNCSFEIIPMLLIPFVENAFKHGIDINKKSWISILLRCDHKGIWFNVRNSLHICKRQKHNFLRSSIAPAHYPIIILC